MKSVALSFVGAAKERLRISLTVWPRVLRLLRNASSRYTVLSALVVLAEVTAVFGLLFSLRALVNAIAATGGAQGSEGQFATVFLILTLTGALIAFSVGLTAASNYVRSLQGIKVGEHVDRLIQEHAINVDIGFYESPKYFDTLQRARQAGSQRPAQLVSRALMVLKSVLFLLGSIAILGAIDWRILPAIFVAVSIAVALRLQFTQKLFDWRRERAQLERRATYLDMLMVSHVSAKEVRIGWLGTHLREVYDAARRQINDTQLAILWQQTASELVVATVGAIVFAGSVAFLVSQTLSGHQSIGDLVLTVLVFRRAESSGRELASNVSQLYDDQLFLSQLFEFLDITPGVVGPVEPRGLSDLDDMELTLRNVSFAYPGSTNNSLEKVNLALRPGKVTAVVGRNGSGKTSLVKLIGRFYDPVDGEILLNGVDIRCFDPIEYRSTFGFIFQDYVRYFATARENVWFGDKGLPFEEERAHKAVLASGAIEIIDHLERGLDTALGRAFDNGQEISLGQWQRIALARALYPASKFVVLDEPTSAIDAHAEAEMFRKFRDGLGGRGALLISHRLTSVMHADHVYVLKEGRIVEEGPVSDLIARDGEFRQLFESQIGN